MSIHRFVSNHHLRRQTMEPEIRRFPGTVLFADISGFTALTERLAEDGPQGVEKLTQIINKDFDRLITIITQHGGDVVKFVGDALFATWSEEDLSLTARRAVQCAQHIQQEQFSLRIGIGSGELVTQFVGGARGQWELVLSGDAVEQASQTNGMAQLGDVVISSECQQYLQSFAVTRPQQDGHLLIDITNPVSLQPLQVLPYEKEESLKSYVPAAVLSRLQDGQEEWIAELRTVTVLFVHLPETDDHVFSSMMAKIQEILHRYEGTLNKVSVDDKGKSVVAVFGLPPFAHENDPLRGIQAALEMKSHFRVQMGLTTGRAYCGVIGNTTRCEYTVMGDVVNVAARLMQAAIEKEKGILIDESTCLATQHDFTFEPLLLLTLKGKREPVRTYIPLLKKEEEHRYEQPLIGREQERKWLLDQIERLQQGEGAVLYLEGEPGIGKSHLVSEFVQVLARQNLHVWTGTGSAIEKTTPYHAWKSIVFSLLGLHQVEESQWVKHVRFVVQDPLAPLLSVVLPFQIPENERTEQMTGQTRANNLQALLLRLLVSFTQNQPQVLILEDAHWFDSATWELIRLAQREIPSLLILVTSRPRIDEIPLQGVKLQKRTLARLSQQKTQSLLAQRLKVRSVPEDIVNLIWRRSEGNPFYSEELAYALRDSGILRIQNDEITLSNQVANLEDLILPDSLEAVITSRIDQLPPSEQLTLKVASVIGRVFARAIVEGIHPVAKNSTQIDSYLHSLEKGDFTRLEGWGEDPTYTFKHIISQEVTYNLLLFQQRKQLHRAIAEWYEKLGEEQDLTPYYAILAYHWSRAEVQSKVIEYTEKLGMFSLKTGASREAVTHFEKLLTLESRAIWEHRLGEALVGLGRLSEARNAFRKALALWGYPSSTSNLRMVTGLSVEVLQQIRYLCRPIRAELHQEEERNKRIESARAYEHLAQISYYNGKLLPGLYQTLRGLNIGERAGDTPEQARSYAVMCLTAGIIPLHRLAQKYEKKALELATASQHLPTMARTFQVTSVYRIGIGDFETAKQRLEQAIQLTEFLGDRRLWEESIASLPHIYYLEGRFQEAINVSRQYYEAACRSENIQTQVWGLVGQAENFLPLGQATEAIECLTHAQSLLTENLMISEKVKIHGLLALAFYHVQDLERALQEAKISNDLLERLPVSQRYGPALYGYSALADMYLGFWEQGILDDSIAPTVFKQCRAFMKASRTFPISHPRAWLLMGRYHWLKQKPKKAHSDWKKGLQIAQRLGMSYEAAMLEKRIRSCYPFE